MKVRVGQQRYSLAATRTESVTRVALRYSLVSAPMTDGGERVVSSVLLIIFLGVIPRMFPAHSHMAAGRSISSGIVNRGKCISRVSGGR